MENNERLEGRKARHNGDTGVITAHIRGGRMVILRIEHETWTEPRRVFVADLEEVAE